MFIFVVLMRQKKFTHLTHVNSVCCTVCLLFSSCYFYAWGACLSLARIIKKYICIHRLFLEPTPFLLPIFSFLQILTFFSTSVKETHNYTTRRSSRTTDTLPNTTTNYGIFTYQGAKIWNDISGICSITLLPPKRFKKTIKSNIIVITKDGCPVSIIAH